jgi:hypothetical protein
MDVLYQFWSPFLIRNHNTPMYAEFCHFAFEDVRQRMTDVGISKLIKFYSKSLLSPFGVIRGRVARPFINLALAEDELCGRPSLQSHSVPRYGDFNPHYRERTCNFFLMICWFRWNCKDPFFGLHSRPLSLLPLVLSQTTTGRFHTLAKSLRSGVGTWTADSPFLRQKFPQSSGIGGSLQGMVVGVMFVLHLNHTPRCSFDSLLCISGIRVHSPMKHGSST